MADRLAGKVALVTGASRGIGKAIAIALGSEAATLILAARTQPALQDVAEQLRAAGVEAMAAVTDMTSEESIRSLVQHVQQEYGRLDILVNNAGVVYAGPLAETATADWDRLMTINARGPFILCREAMGMLKQAHDGRIVNISSVVGVKGYPNQTAYTASKHALRGMSMALAEEVKDHGVRVHVVCPGGVATDMVGSVRPDIDKKELIQPEEIAELVLYLVTHHGNAVVDELRIRRASSAPWF